MIDPVVKNFCSSPTVADLQSASIPSLRSRSAGNGARDDRTGLVTLRNRGASHSCEEDLSPHRVPSGFTDLLGLARQSDAVGMKKVVRSAENDHRRQTVQITGERTWQVDG